MSEKFFNKWIILNMILIKLYQWIKDILNKFRGKKNDDVFTK